MASKRGDLFNNLFKAFVSAHPQTSNGKNQADTVTFWKTAKQNFKDPDEFDKCIQAKIDSLNLLKTKSKAKNFLNYFAKPSSLLIESTSSGQKSTIAIASTSASSSSINSQPPAQPHSSSSIESTIDKSSSHDTASTFASSLSNCEPLVQSSNSSSNLNRNYPTLSQDQTRQCIAAYDSQIASLTMIRDANGGGKEIDDQIKVARNNKKKKEQLLKSQKRNAKNQQEFRVRQRAKKVMNQGGSGSGNVQIQVGRPPKEKEYPELLQAICDIAIFNSAADERRRTEEIRTCNTLDDLTRQLNDKGFKLSRSGVYLRLLPRRSDTVEGMRHVRTVPVKLAKPQNDLHTSHVDSKFCSTTIKNVETVAATLGPKQVSYISQDDKCKVKIGCTSATKQSPKLMHVEYRIKLPDHDWAIANRHSLIPSVYAGICINEKFDGSPENVTFSGPTYIAIRSGKHSSSTAATHCNDIDRLYELESFNDILYYIKEIA